MFFLFSPQKDLGETHYFIEPSKISPNESANVPHTRQLITNARRIDDDNDDQTKIASSKSTASRDTNYIAKMQENQPDPSQTTAIATTSSASNEKSCASTTTNENNPQTATRAILKNAATKKKADGRDSSDDDYDEYGDGGVEENAKNSEKATRKSGDDEVFVPRKPPSGATPSEHTGKINKILKMNFFRRKEREKAKALEELENSLLKPSPPLPVVRFDSDGDFFKEPTECRRHNPLLFFLFQLKGGPQ